MICSFFGWILCKKQTEPSLHILRFSRTISLHDIFWSEGLIYNIKWTWKTSWKILWCPMLNALMVWNILVVFSLLFGRLEMILETKLRSDYLHHTTNTPLYSCLFLPSCSSSWAPTWSVHPLLVLKNVFKALANCRSPSIRRERSDASSSPTWVLLAGSAWATQTSQLPIWMGMPITSSRSRLRGTSGRESYSRFPHPDWTWVYVFLKERQSGTNTHKFAVK